jgi:hypothetical protein
MKFTLEWLILCSLFIFGINNRGFVDRNSKWKLKVPLKNKIFMWYMHKRVVLTRDYLVKRT